MKPIELRQKILETVSRNGGHLASSLGAVEIIVAVHSLINSPKDRFVFDVGHQAYAHKLLTGRREAFDTLRQKGGISGFPKPDESPHDVHPSGHASDSLSIALGLAKARALKGTDEKIVALIGDASLSCALNAINEVAVNALLQGKIKFLDIINIVKRSMDKINSIKIKSIEDIIYCDKIARKFANNFI